jgi:hypothetical protein
MSTKTLRKRIALVAVSALGAGLLSVVAVPSANAGFDASTAASGIELAANVSTGVTALNADPASGASVGLLAKTGSGTTITATLLATGTLSGAVKTNGGAGDAAYATITGGIFTSVTGGTYNSTQTKITATNNNTSMGFYAKPNTGAASMTIQSFSASGVVSSAVVTIAASSVAGVLSTANSTVYFDDNASGATATTDATAANSNKPDAGVCYGEVTLLDAYKAAIPASAGVLTATVTGGGLIKFHASNAGTSTLDYATSTGSAISFNVKQATANVPAKLSIAFAFEGVTFATKTCNIAGEVAKVTASSPKIGKVSGTPNTGAAVISYADSAGNPVYPTSGTSAVSSSLTATAGVVTAITVGTYPDATPTAGALTVTCAKSGVAKGLQVQHLNASGTLIKSNTWDAGCADVPYTASASWDKASYKRGEIATLTVTFKDVDGNLANAYDEVVNNTGPSSAADLTVTGAPGTIVTAIADGDKPSGTTGSKTYQYTVTLEDGAYNAIIVPAVVKVNNALQANLSVPFSVTSVAGVTNADVLKAIVSLIASINKQIAALQKALLKR